MALFNRRYRGVVLSSQGETLASTLVGNFSDLSAALKDIKNSNLEQSVSISATTAVSALWLTPKLAEFWKQHSNISINQHVSDDPEQFDTEPNLSIRYGNFQPDNRLKNELFIDELVPVCSPEFASTHSINNLKNLAQLPLIHLTAKDSNWTTWHSWFKKMGYKGSLNKGLQVNNYMIALQTACDGAGLVLGWKHLVKPMLKQGTLVALGDFHLNAPAPFHIISKQRNNLNKNTQLVLDWLLSINPK